MRTLRTLGYLIPLFLLACTTSFDAELMQVDELSRNRLEVGDDVTVEGGGFFSGRRARLTFIGTLRRPGQRPESCRVTTRGLAVSSDRITFPVTEELLVSVDGRATFEGDFHVAFPTADGTGLVSGTLREVRLDFIPGPAQRLAGEIARRDEAHALEGRLGLTLQEDQTRQGLIVASVEEGGLAAEQGIGFGDRVQAIDGVWLDSHSDFVPTPGDARTQVQLVRSGESEPRVISFDLASRVMAEGGEGLSVVVAGVGGLLILMLLTFFAPTARWLGWTSRQCARSDSRGNWLSPLIETYTGKETSVRVRWGLASMAIAGVITLTLGGFPLMADIIPGGADAGMLVLVAIACRLTVVRLIGRDTQSSVWTLALYQLPSLIVLGAVLVYTGSLRLEGVVQAQGAWPWEWLIFKQPAVLLVFPAFLVTSLSSAVTHPSPPASWLLIVERAFLLVMAGVGTVLMWGGWAPIGAGVIGELAGVILFVLKAWTMLLMALFVAHARRRERAGNPWAWVVPTSLVAGGASVGWLLIDVPPEISQLSGVLLCVFVVIVGAYVLSRCVGGRAPDGELHLYPFL